MRGGPEHAHLRIGVVSQGLHSSTLQLNVSTIRGLHTPTIRLDVSTLCAMLGGYNIDKKVSA